MSRVISDDLLDNYKHNAKEVRTESGVFTVHSEETFHISNGLETIETRWLRSEDSIGSGVMGDVYLEVRQQHGTESIPEVRAIKIINKIKLNQNGVDYRKEVLAFIKLSKPQYIQAQVFVDFKGWYHDDRKLYLLMEYSHPGDLSRHIPAEGLPEIATKQITRRLLVGLRFMHAEGLTHRDLKPQNIFVMEKPPGSEQWIVKIGDFGIAKRTDFHNTVLRTNTGTPLYQAPEIEDDGNDVYSNAVDMWSLGCVLYQMATGTTPFKRPYKEVRKYCKNISLFPESALVAKLNPEGVSLVKSLMHPRPEHRPSARSALSDRWFISEPATDQQLDMAVGVPQTEPGVTFERIRETTRSKEATTVPSAPNTTRHPKFRDTSNSGQIHHNQDRSLSLDGPSSHSSIVDTEETSPSPASFPRLQTHFAKSSTLSMYKETQDTHRPTSVNYAESQNETSSSRKVSGSVPRFTPVVNSNTHAGRTLPRSMPQQEVQRGVGLQNPGTPDSYATAADGGPGFEQEAIYELDASQETQKEDALASRQITDGLRNPGTPDSRATAADGGLSLEQEAIYELDASQETQKEDALASRHITDETEDDRFTAPLASGESVETSYTSPNMWQEQVGETIRLPKFVIEHAIFSRHKKYILCRAKSDELPIVF